ncbi:hypothetical protein P0D88_49755 [Paraburkholderia sp. RL18-103-BIB-C]|uniref:hypothetical protein n=1 Tax=unclassified Paraburkholderia TaxID=2615204 RepID=UPI0038B812FE
MTPIRTAAEYEQALTIVNAILDMIGDDEDHPLAEALDLIANQVEALEAVHVKFDAELYHYDTCGRDDVWLENGVISRQTEYGPANSIIDADGLQALIDRAGPGRLVFRHTDAGWVSTPTR